jgi:hypothetical protein
MQDAMHDTRCATFDSQAWVRHKNKTPELFYAPSASAANALQSNLSGVSEMPACVR